MTKQLPERPDLGQLKKQAKDLLHDARAGQAGAVARVDDPERLRGLTLQDTQRAIAREYGFPSWAKLKAHVESLPTPADAWQALSSAVTANDVAAARRVLARHPEIKSRLNEPMHETAFGAPPIVAAVSRQNRKMIDLLVRAGADINARTHWWAGSFGVLDSPSGIESFLIDRGAVVDAHAAARLGRLDRVAELIAADPTVVHARGGDGQTPLHFAASTAVADYLLKHGANIDALDIDHESTPAQWMVRDRPDVARFLVARGCRTDILLASALGDIAAVRRHLDSDPACVRVRVGNRCFPKQDPRAGGTIYQWTLGPHKSPHAVAHEFGHQEIFSLLIARSSPELQWTVACLLGDDALIASARASRPEVPGRLDKDDLPKLAETAQDNNTAAVKTMLNAGWPANVRADHSATPVHWAAFHGNLEMLEALLRHHPDLEAVDSQYSGRPMGWAIHGSTSSWCRKKGNYAGVVEALLKAGATPPKSVGGSADVQAMLRRFGVKDESTLSPPV